MCSQIAEYKDAQSIDRRRTPNAHRMKEKDQDLTQFYDKTLYQQKCQNGNVTTQQRHQKVRIQSDKILILSTVILHQRSLTPRLASSLHLFPYDPCTNVLRNHCFIPPSIDFKSPRVNIPDDINDTLPAAFEEIR